MTFLHVGFAAGIGLTLADFLRLQARAEVHNTPSKEGVAKSVIFIYLPGGAPHQETFDPKPYAPVEYRGPMGSIATNVDGIVLNECLAQTAKVADKIAFCRSMTHGEAAHERGTHNMFTGYKPSPALAFPSMGSVVTHEFPPQEQFAAVCLHSQHAERIRGDGLSRARRSRRSVWAAIRPTAASACRISSCPAT